MSETTLTVTEEFQLEWPGWTLAGNIYGDEFDKQARIRMILGGRKLVPFITGYASVIKGSLLEVGPFFNPLISNKGLTDVLANDFSVTFLENDPYAAEWLGANFDCTMITLDINDEAFPKLMQNQLAGKEDGKSRLFGNIILSQVLNYVCPATFFETLFPHLRTGGLIFINNVINYGIPQLFSPHGPKSNEELKNAALKAGFHIVEEHLLAPEFEKEPEDRLILILSK